MPMGCIVTRLFTTEAVTVQKCAVLPESAIAVLSGGIIVGGGPTMAAEEKHKPESLETLDGMLSDSTVETCIGSPRRQLAGAGTERRLRPGAEEADGEAVRRG